MTVISLRYKHVVEQIDRHGNLQRYYREGKGKRIRLREEPGTDAFHAEYQAAQARTAGVAAVVLEVAADRPSPARRALPGSFRAAVIEYFESAEFRSYDLETRKARRRLFDEMFDERMDPSKAEPVCGDCPLDRMDAAIVKKLRDRKVSTPEAGNHRLKALRKFFEWAVEDRTPPLATNPAAGVERFNTATLGHHTWSLPEIEQFLAHHKPRSKARLAFALAAFTGLRVSDLAKVGPQHIRGGWLRLPIHKGRAKKPKVLEIPVLPALAHIIAETPPPTPRKPAIVGHMVFLLTDYGAPYSIKGLGNKFKAWCEDAGLPHCSAHGIRKAGATYAAERGATEHQLMALFGWDDPKQAATYTKAARKKVLAESAIGFLASPQIENETPHLEGAMDAGEGISGKKERKINAS